MNILIAILSCDRDRPYHQQARNTWLAGCPVDYKFILSDPQYRLQQDELSVNAPDGAHEQLISKEKKLFEYAISRYDFIFKCDIDTYCHVPRLLKSGFEKHNWSGFGEPYGGSGYWLDRKCLEILHDQPVPTERISEDSWASKILRMSGLKCFQDSRYHSLTNIGPANDNDLITSHWYMEYGALRNEKVYDRIVGPSERLNLISKYHEIAKCIGPSRNFVGYVQEHYNGTDDRRSTDFVRRNVYQLE